MAEKLKLILKGPKESPPHGHQLEDLLENVSLRFQNLESHNKELEETLRTT